MILNQTFLSFRGQSLESRQDSSKIEVHLKSSLKSNLFGSLSNPSLRSSFPCNACIKRYLSRVSFSFHLHQPYLQLGELACAPLQFTSTPKSNSVVQQLFNFDFQARLYVAFFHFFFCLSHAFVSIYFEPAENWIVKLAFSKCREQIIDWNWHSITKRRERKQGGRGKKERVCVESTGDKICQGSNLRDIPGDSF